MSGDFTPLKSDRRHWNKSNCELFDFESHPAEIEQNEAQKRYEDYLINLQINNQIQKLSNQKDKRQEELEKLENGFKLFTNGAHQNKEKYTPRYTTASKSSLNSKKSHNFTPRTSPALLQHFEKQQNNSSTFLRKKWANSSFTIKTSDGCQIKIHAPHHFKEETNNKNNNNRLLSNDCTTTDDYSDDFESDESESEFSGKALIESVMFSDDEIEDEIGELVENEISLVKNKKFVFHLSNEDAKILRDSISCGDFAGIRESLIVEKTSNLESVSEDEKEAKKESVCDLIIKQAVGLCKEDRDNLINFLTEADSNEKALWKNLKGKIQKK